MNAKHIYLDSSAIVKRYVKEVGSEAVDVVFDNAEMGKIKISFSIWNIGEVLGVFDRYSRGGLLAEEDLRRIILYFLSETIKLSKLGGLHVMPITHGHLIDSWLMVLKHHIYVSDALQVASSKGKCDVLLSGDERLVKIARLEGVDAVNIEKSPDEAVNSTQ
ncbi:MAG: type II toxin-antitoxin system VapC family toxin [Candidatus Bathyarchaeia archaeon]|nr:type II toxin-antitoxin system VapC family toxin [Candidatus Bathyarchaeota archaeon]